ncbi:MAG: methyltransferase domain-containing protein [Proteobacteria bacterium]|nr:methyltransferase domain-containing protein [Pseudomonadota bacterium]
MTAGSISQTQPPGLLGDTPARDYVRKLQLFHSFAEPELRRAVAGLELTPGARVLDAGCGSGAALEWFAAAVGAHGLAVGIDLATAHVAAARAAAPRGCPVLQADLLHMPLAPASFDLVWSVNTVNHLRDPCAGVQRLAALLRPGGRLALGQSSLLPDMYFAWDARLERVVNEAVRHYYRDRYGLQERELTAVRGLAGLLRAARLRDVAVRTFTIERLTPLRAADEAYLLDAIFRGTWGGGEKLRPYLCDDDYEELGSLCDPGDRRYALRRADFHFLQTFTLAVAGRGAGT